MNKVIFYILVMFLAACSEKQDYEKAVAEQMKQDKDLQDYKVDPEIMTKCVVSTSSDNMPGAFPLDPARLTAYKNYAKMLKLNTSSDPKKTLEELRVDFGDAKKLSEAHAIYTESVMNCLSGLVGSNEIEEKEKEKDKKNELK